MGGERDGLQQRLGDRASPHGVREHRFEQRFVGVMKGLLERAFGRTDGWAIIPGNTITVELTTDYSVTKWGLRTDYASAYY